MRVKEPTAWVVYRMELRGTADGRNAVCSQNEWEAMELAKPGVHTLIRGNIRNEGEAEQLARNLQTPPVPPKSPYSSPKVRLKPPGEVPAAPAPTDS